MRSLAGSAAFFAMSFLPGALHAQASQSARPRAQIIAAAVDVMQSARYATLVTLGTDGHPQARVVDPFAPDSSLTIWIATNALTRKVGEIRRDPRVTLLYFDTAAREYVTILGRAQLISDPAEKAKHWKPDWKAFYKDENRGADYLLIRVRPSHLEVLSPRHGLNNDPVTWRPVTLELP